MVVPLIGRCQALGAKAVNGGRLRARFPTGFHRSNNFPSCGRNPGGLIYQKMAEGGGHAPQPEWLPTVWFSRPTRRFDDSPSIETRIMPTRFRVSCTSPLSYTGPLLRDQMQNKRQTKVSSFPTSVDDDKQKQLSAEMTQDRL